MASEDVKVKVEKDVKVTLDGDKSHVQVLSSGKVKREVKQAVNEENEDFAKEEGKEDEDEEKNDKEDEDYDEDKEEEEDASDSPASNQEARPETLKNNPHFQMGRFVVRKGDVAHVNESYPVWKIEQSLLLRKYTPFVENNALYHHVTNSYNTLLCKTMEYHPIEVFEVRQGIVKVEAKFQPTLSDLNNDNLIRPFKRYLNALIGQVIDSGHFDKLRAGKNKYYLTEVDDLIAQKLQAAEESYEWSPTFKKLIKQKPILQLHGHKLPKDKDVCQACPVTSSVHQHAAKTKTIITLSGEIPIPDSPVVVTEDNDEDEGVPLFICLKARRYLPRYHGLTHLRYHLFQKCHQKVSDLTMSGVACTHAPMAEIICEDRNWVHERLRELKVHLFNGGS